MALLLLPSAAFAATSHYFTATDGARLHYLEAGRGNTLVFVPGWRMPAEIWSPQIAHFARHHRVVAFDPRAQGRSQVTSAGYTVERRARDIKELLERLGETPVVLVGWSLGVLESLAYAREFGDARLAALVLVDNSIGEEPPPSFDPTFLERLRRDPNATVRGFVRGMYRTPQSAAYLEGITRAALRVPLEASIALLSYPRPREYWRESAYGVGRPMLYAVSPRFRGQAQNFKARRPQARIEIFEKAGHALFVDEAARFNAVLDEFIASAVWPRGERS